MDVAILVPALDRPANVAPLLESIHSSAGGSYRVLFICDPDDDTELQAITREGGEMIAPGGGYAVKIRAGVAATSESLLFLAADDLRFEAGWFEAAAEKMPGAQVVGVNDGIRRPHRPRHATHFLMTRGYAEMPCIDGSPGPLSDAYSHSFTDDELIATATKRGVYMYAERSRVTHLHPIAGTAEDDDTYRRGRAQFRQDRKTFVRRSVLWA